ncbi:MAG: YcaO-like family protein, partial [Candidatus Lokiarchaeota archaeon]
KCPDIQPKYLNYKNRKYLNIFEKNGIEVKIKDLSLGVGIPSVGLLLKHDRRILEGTQRFHYQNSFPFNSNKILEFKAGSGTNINVALDRCFTETIQCGYNRIHRLLSSEYHLSRAYSLYNIFPQISNYLSLHAFLTLRYAHHGFYPTSKLSFLEEDKNEYEDWDYSDKNLLNEIRNLISLCIKNNWRIYVRDYSWLGFPTLKVFSPELYFGFGEYLQYETKDVFKFKNQILRNFRSINNSNLPILLDPAFLIHIALNNSFNKFFNFGLQIHDSLSMWEFFSLLAYSQNEDKIAKKYFLQYLTEWNSNIFRIKSFKSDRNKISSFLESLIPNCGKNICRNCQYYDKCKYPILKSLEKSIIHKRPDIFERVVPQQEYQELDKFF